MYKTPMQRISAIPYYGIRDKSFNARAWVARSSLLDVPSLTGYTGMEFQFRKPARTGKRGVEARTVRLVAANKCVVDHFVAAGSAIQLRNIAATLCRRSPEMVPISANEGFEIIEGYRQAHAQLMVIGTVREGLALSPALIASTSPAKGTISIGLLEQPGEPGCTCEFSMTGAKVWHNPTGVVSREDNRHIWKSSLRIQFADGAELILGEPSSHGRD
jgi:hypothetical protein